MVPVGGSLVAAPAGRPGLVAAVNGTYPGRAAVAAHLDLLMTLLHWGAAGWRKVGGFPCMISKAGKGVHMPAGAAEPERLLTGVAV